MAKIPSKTSKTSPKAASNKAASKADHKADQKASQKASPKEAPKASPKADQKASQKASKASQTSQTSKADQKASKAPKASPKATMVVKEVVPGQKGEVKHRTMFQGEDLSKDLKAAAQYGDSYILQTAQLSDSQVASINKALSSLPASKGSKWTLANLQIVPS